MNEALAELFDARTLGGLLALVSVHAHLAVAHVRLQRRVRQVTRLVDVLAHGHGGDVDAHRELGQMLTEARRE